jgi:hypothetical protein
VSMHVQPMSDDGWQETEETKFSVDPHNPSIILEFIPDDDPETIANAAEGDVVGGHLACVLNNIAKAEAIVALQTLLDDLNRQVPEADVHAAHQSMSGHPNAH